MKLITGLQHHQIAILDAIEHSGVIQMAVAFVKQSGVILIVDSLVKAADRGCIINIICGLDFAQTEPQALKMLYQLSKKYNSFHLFLASPKETNRIFHPKVYYFKTEERSTVIIGSANLTSGGLQNNHECSSLSELVCGSSGEKEIEIYFEEIIASDYCETATLFRIKRYEAFYDQQKTFLKIIRAKPPVNKVTHGFNYDRLKQYYEVYKTENDIDKLFTNKTQDYKKAKKILNKIADHQNLTKPEFTVWLEQLVGSATYDQLWHSGSIKRMKTSVFDYCLPFQELVRFIRSNKEKNVEFVFTNAKQMVKEIYGSGINTVTEIMMTYNPQKFANLNANPIKVLREAAGLAIKSHRNSFNGDDYQEYCEIVKEISEEFNLRNMLEADSFFNDVYWDLVDSNKRER